MSEAREALAAVLAAHPDVGGMLTEGGDYLKYVCECGEGSSDHQWHRAHLADVILREWLPGALADERVVEAAANGISDVKPYPPSVIDEATAALSAAVTALIEDDA